MVKLTISLILVLLSLGIVEAETTEKGRMYSIGAYITRDGSNETNMYYGSGGLLSSKALITGKLGFRDTTGAPSVTTFGVGYTVLSANVKADRFIPWVELSGVWRMENDRLSFCAPVRVGALWMRTDRWGFNFQLGTDWGYTGVFASLMKFQ